MLQKPHASPFFLLGLSLARKNYILVEVREQKPSHPRKQQECPVNQLNKLSVACNLREGLLHLAGLINNVASSFGMFL